MQPCPTYYNERRSRCILNEINIYIYIVSTLYLLLETWLLLLEDDNFYGKKIDKR